MMIFSLLCALFQGVRAADYNYLVFTTNDGSEQAIVATGLSITLTDGNLVAATASETLASIPLASLQKMQPRQPFVPSRVGQVVPPFKASL